MSYYFSKFENYYNSLKNNTNIYANASNLYDTSKMQENIIKNNYMNKIMDSKWQEDGKLTIVQGVLQNICDDITKLTGYLENNLLQACNLSINSLLPVLENIKTNDTTLDASLIELDEYKKQLAITNSKIEKTITNENGEDEITFVSNPKYENIISRLNSIQSRIIEIKNKLNNLSDEAIKYITQIMMLGGADIETVRALKQSLSVSLISKDIMEKADVTEYINSINSLNNGEVTEIPFNIMDYLNRLYGTGYYAFRYTVIEDLSDLKVTNDIQFYYNLPVLKKLLDGNKYQDVILDYVANYGKEGFDVNYYIEKYNLPKPVSDKYKFQNDSLFNFAITEKGCYDDEAKEAMSIVLDHVTYETLKHYSDEGNLTITENTRIRAIIMGSDFVTTYAYGGIQEDKLFLDGSQSMNKAEKLSCLSFADSIIGGVLEDYTTSGKNAIDGVAVKGSPLQKLMGSGQYIGASRFKQVSSDWSESGYKNGEIVSLANDKSGAYHVGIPTYEAVDSEGNTFVIVMESAPARNMRWNSETRCSEKEYVGFAGPRIYSSTAFRGAFPNHLTESDLMDIGNGNLSTEAVNLDANYNLFALGEE